MRQRQERLDAGEGVYTRHFQRQQFGGVFPMRVAHDRPSIPPDESA